MATLEWVKPVLVVEVEFVEWTAEALLRHSRFVGVRDDKRASAIRRE
jgi:ATP-dependent DNA ligase